MTSIAERVAKGVEWLDSQEPGWDKRIDLPRLDLANHCRCVLGQIYGDFYDRPDEIWTTPGAHGFVITDEYEGFDEWEALEAEWRRVITSRREATDA